MILPLFLINWHRKFRKKTLAISRNRPAVHVLPELLQRKPTVVFRNQRAVHVQLKMCTAG